MCPKLEGTFLRGKWFIIDSGASTDVLSLEDFSRLFPEYVRQTQNKLTFQTANDVVDASKGVRVRIADWDTPSDAVLMQNSPNLTSLGARCMHAGMSFIWIREKYPCAFTEDMRLIIIFDLDGVIPLYKADLEGSSEKLGTFELAMNAFGEQCGITINKAGKISLELPTVKMKSNLAATLPVDTSCNMVASPMGHATSSLPSRGPPGVAVPAPVVDSSGALGIETSLYEVIPPCVSPSRQSLRTKQFCGSYHPLCPNSASGADRSCSRQATSTDAPGGAVMGEDELPDTVEEIVDKLKREQLSDAALPDTVEEIIAKLRSEQNRAKSLEHLLDHTPFCASCEGCLAKSRAKKHFTGAFTGGDTDHTNTVSMDQLSLSDVENSVGIGGYKYGIVYSEL